MWYSLFCCQKKFLLKLFFTSVFFFLSFFLWLSFQEILRTCVPFLFFIFSHLIYFQSLFPNLLRELPYTTSSSPIHTSTFSAIWILSLTSNEITVRKLTNYHIVSRSMDNFCYLVFLWTVWLCWYSFQLLFFISLGF